MALIHFSSVDYINRVSVFHSNRNKKSVRVAANSVNTTSSPSPNARFIARFKDSLSVQQLQRPLTNMVNQTSCASTDPNSSLQELTADALIEVTVDILFAFRAIPVQQMESAGTQVLVRILKLMLPCFMAQAEFVFASHWRYKEGGCKHSSFVLQMVEWARWVVTWQCETMNKGWGSISYGDSSMPHCSFPFHAENCPHSYKSPCGHDGPVFVIMMENDKMSLQEFPANSTMVDLLERAGRGSSKWTPYKFPIKEELRPRLNHKSVKDPTCKLKIGDVIELTPAISDKSLTKYKEEMQRMYDSGLTLSTN